MKIPNRDARDQAQDFFKEQKEVKSKSARLREKKTVEITSDGAGQHSATVTVYFATNITSKDHSKRMSKGAKRQKVEKEEIEILRFYFDITVQGSEF